MEYRANFLIYLFIHFLWAGLDLVFTLVIVGVGRIGDWTVPQAIIAFCLLRIVDIVPWGWFLESFSLLPSFVNDGGMDTILTKPIDSQYLISIKKFSFSMIISNLVGGTIALIYIFYKYNIWPSAIQYLSFAFLLVISLFLIYGMYFLSMTVLLYTNRLNNIQQLFIQLFDMSRLPKEVYVGAARIILTSILPIALMIAVPAEALFKGPDPLMWIYFVVLAIVFLFLGRWSWSNGLRKYASASS